jgi:hypothetical protein
MNYNKIILQLFKLLILMGYFCSLLILNLKMKKILLILSFVTLFSCEKNVEFNKTTMQAKIDNSFWKAATVIATKGSGSSISITGSTGVNDVTLKLNNVIPGKYNLGTTISSNKASYVSNANNLLVEYTTGVTAGPASSATIQSAGTNYVTGIAKLTTTSSPNGGTGLKVDITANASGVITDVKINTPGTGYKAGDVVSITGGDQNGFIKILNTSNSNGEIIIEEFDGATITGSFKFTASNNSNAIVCRDGLFYKVPVN